MISGFDPLSLFLIWFFPDHKPHYGELLTDGNLIFVIHYKSPLEQTKVCLMDIFNTKGVYLYKATCPVEPQIIKNGFVYLIESSEDTGEVRVKRYRIKNWEQMKKGIN